MCDLTNPIYHDAEKARKHLEAIHWPKGPICPHCKTENKATKLEGKSHRPGLYKCNECRRQFTVTVGTIFERSKVPLNKWVLAAQLMASSKKGYSAHQLHRTIGVTYKTAWFMFHRLREAMKPKQLEKLASGNMSGPVEADETYIGTDKEKMADFVESTGRKPKAGFAHKNAVFTLIERNGEARSFVITGSMFDGVKKALKDNVDPSAWLMTDEAKMYKKIAKNFAGHGTVNHSEKEWKRGINYTNTAESFFSVFKRGMKGIYQHCGSQHLQRYLHEFDFRYNHRSANGIEDSERATILLEGASGKRLMYKRSAEEARA